MIAIIQNAYVNALLADAAYVNVTPGMMPEDLSTALSEESKRFPQHLAEFIAANFEVASAITSPDGSGFDATVWRGRAGTEFAAEMRKWGQVLPFASAAFEIRP